MSEQVRQPLSARAHEARKLILDSAERRFFDLGFDGARLVDITADVERTTGTVYRYFAGKDDLYLGLFDRLDDGLQAALDSADDLQQACEGWIATCDRHAGTVRAKFEVTKVGGPVHERWWSARERWVASAGRTLERERSLMAPHEAAVLVDLLEHHAYARLLGWTERRRASTEGSAVADLFRSGVYLPDRPALQVEVPRRSSTEFQPYLNWEPADDKSVPTSKRGLETFEDIQRAAELVFSNKGIKDSSALDVAQELGISTGTIYRYFADKEDIFRSLQASAERSVIEESFLPLLDDGTQDVAAVLGSYLSVWRSRSGIFRAWWDLMQPGTETQLAWVGMRRRFVDYFVRVIRYGQRNGLVSPDLDLAATGSLYASLVERAAHVQIVLGGYGIDDSELAAVIDGIVKPPRSKAS